MNSNRRNFLRNLTLGTGAIVTGGPAFATVIADESDRRLMNKATPSAGSHRQGLRPIGPAKSLFLMPWPVICGCLERVNANSGGLACGESVRHRT